MTRQVVRTIAGCAALALMSAGCSSGPSGSTDSSKVRPSQHVAYQLQNYKDDKLDEIAAGPYRIAIIDLARDTGSDYFTPGEIATVRNSGKRVLAYFEIGSIEDFRPEYPGLAARRSDLLLNPVSGWPGEHFVRYWDEQWWESVVKPRIDQAINAGFDGAYLDTLIAYEQISLHLVPGETRDSLGAKAVDLIRRISTYAKQRHPGFQIFPQNNPELQKYPGYTAAIDGIGMEEMFFQATDEPCEEDFCRENLDNARKLRRAGKTVIAIDYARKARNIAAACRRYGEEGFAGSVTVRALDRLTKPCP